MAKPEDIYNNLISRLREYHPSKDFSLIKKAYLLAEDAHKNQIRKSGEPYLIHPISVAYILADLELDIESIISGLLHDIIEDTEYTYEYLVEIFGKEITDIVQGVTKLDNIEDNLKDERKLNKDKKLNTLTKNRWLQVDLQAENYRKMFIAMAKDIRVILIKIADRLHNMRTLQYMSFSKQQEKAQETLDIYAPLAHRLGISKLRYELEDISFKYLYPEEYKYLKEEIFYHKKNTQSVIDKIIAELDIRLAEINIDFVVDGRTKHLFSIFKKMKTQNKSLEQIFDIFAVRIIVNKQLDCYEVLGIIHDMYKPMPSRFKDYIGMPKANMYQSIHTVVVGPTGEPVEIQIRTWDMHRTAEYGIAAHWKYKEGNSLGKLDKEEEKLAWLRQMLDWQKDLFDNDFLEALKTDLNIFSDNVYCFSPKGEIISLIKGSTPLDFAYAIHSELGHRMIGVKVNGSIVPFNYELISGDRVTIIDNKNSKGPSMDWLNIVKTNQARSKIMNWFNKENREEHITKGKEAIEKEIKRKGYNLSDVLTSKIKTLLVDKYSFKDWDSLCAAIGRGGFKEGIAVNRIEEYYKKEHIKLNSQFTDLDIKEDIQIKKVKTHNTLILVNGLNDVSVRFSKCCSPLPGDEIIGFITRGRGISVHRSTCSNVISLKEKELDRIIKIEWAPHITFEKAVYDVDIQILIESNLDTLNHITQVIANENISITSINSKMNKEVTTLNIGVVVQSKIELEKLIRKIEGLNNVIKVIRFK